MTKFKYFILLEIRIVAYVITVKMYMINLGVLRQVQILSDIAKIGLPKLITTACASSAKLDIHFFQSHLQFVPEIGIGFGEYEIKGIITATLQIKINAICLTI